MRRLLLPCLIVVCALGFAACGGGGDSDEAQIEDAIVSSASDSEASDCTELVTLKFAEQSTQESGDAAIVACEEEAEDPSGDADEVTVSKIEIDGSGATAVAELSGGGFDGQTVSIALVKQDEQWKLDEITGFVEFDAAALARTLDAGLEAGGLLSKEQLGCIVERIGSVSQKEAEGLLLSRSSDRMVELVEGCE
jgi:hypothetical protein